MGRIFAIAAAAAAITALCTTPAQAEPVVIYQLAGTNRCLADVNGDIRFQFCNRSAAVQRWIVPISGGVDWPHNTSTGKCLGAVADGAVNPQSCGASNNQRWRRVPPGATSFQFRNVGLNKCLTAQLTVADCATVRDKWVGLR